MNDSNEQGISRRPNECSPTVFRSPIPMLRGVHEPKRVVLGRASIDLFGMDQPKLEGGKDKESERKSVAANKQLGGV